MTLTKNTSGWFQKSVFTNGIIIAPGVLTTSDIRLKKEILPISNALFDLLKINPVSYLKKSSLASTNYTIKENGFIAQDLQKVFPDLVNEGKDEDKLLSVNYISFIPLLTKAIQEQQSQIEDHKKIMVEQQKEIDELKKMMQTLLNKKQVNHYKLLSKRNIMKK